MASVPQYGDFKVSPAGPVSTTVRPPDTSGMGAEGRQLSQFGQQLEGTGEEYSKIVANEQNKANDIAVINAENQAREAAIHLTVDENDGYTNVKGDDVVNRPSGIPLADDYAQRYQEKLNEISGGLSNDVQKQAFQRSAGVLANDFYDKAKAYESDQYHGWQQSVLKGSATLAGQEIALNYNDPSMIDQRLGTLDVSVAKLGELNGISGDEITALQNTARSEALTQAITTALSSDDVGTAQGLFDRYKDRPRSRGSLETVSQRLPGRASRSRSDRGHDAPDDGPDARAAAAACGYVSRSGGRQF